MITRIEIDGFKSLRAFSLDLEPLTAIVGPNGAGKSNLLDALGLLSRVAEASLLPAFKAGRGRIRDQFTRTLEGAERALRIAVELLLPRTRPHGKELAHTRVRYEIEVERTVERAGLEGLAVTRERIMPIFQENDAWSMRHTRFSGLARYDAPDLRVELENIEGQERLVRIEPGDGGPSLCVDIARDRSFLSLPYALVTPIVEAVSQALRGFRTLHLEPQKLRQPSDRAAGTMLLADGSNLPTVLASLGYEARARIRRDVETLVPAFRGFEVVPFEDEMRLEVEFLDGKRLPARLLSDGALRLLALFTLLRSCRPGSLVAIEEPENGIYPGRVRALMEVLLSVTSASGAPSVNQALVPQILLSTHSPAIIEALRDRPSSLVFADVVRGRDGMRATRMRHVLISGDEEAASGVPSVSSAEMVRLLDSARPWDELMEE